MGKARLAKKERWEVVACMPREAEIAFEGLARAYGISVEEVFMTTLEYGCLILAMPYEERMRVQEMIREYASEMGLRAEGA